MDTNSITPKYFVPTGTIWPSGDFSLGSKKIDRHGPRRRDRRTMLQAYDESQSGRWTAGAIAQREAYSYAGGIVDALDAEDFHANPGKYEYGDGATGPLDLTNARNSHTVANRPEKYGKLGITGFGRKMVKSAATLVQKMPHKRVTFATVTMPTLPKQLRRELALCWPEFLRQLLQWLSRQLKRQGLPPLVCSVTEIQPKRLAEHQEAYLHLHLVWPNHWAKSGNWAIDVDRLRSWCAEFLQGKGLWCEGAWVNVDTKQVEKTAAGYLSKYMSKGSDELHQFAEDCGWDAVPGQWWNLTAPLRALVKKYTRKGQQVGELLECMLSYVWNTGDMSGFHWLHEICLQYEGRSIQVGWFGALTQDFRKQLLKMLDTPTPASAT
jgi:hypothetical protein